MTNVSLPKTGVEVFASPHNITVGKGRVLWGPATTDANGKYYPSAWVLPGGHRTQNRELAETVAHNINRISQ